MHGVAPNVAPKPFAINLGDRTGILGLWCPESDLNQRPTAYEAGALPLSYRGSDRQATAGACRDELLASNPAQAKPFRDINPWSRSWAQFRGGLAIPVAAREASGDGR